MGSIDVVAAKQQFLSLIDAISSSHLPSFAIWLDTKLAEYKVNGILGADDEQAEKRQYPEWITKSLRQNLSSILDCGPSVETQKTEDRQAQYTDTDHSNDGSAQHYSNTSGYASHQATSDTFAVKVEVSSDEDNDLESYPAEAQRGAGVGFMASDYTGGTSAQVQQYQASSHVSSPIAGIKRGADSQLLFTPPKQARTLEHQPFNTLPYQSQSPVVSTPTQGSPFMATPSQGSSSMTTPSSEGAGPLVSEQPIVVPATLAEGVVLPSCSSNPDDPPAPPGTANSSGPPDFTLVKENILSFQPYSSAAKTFPCDFCAKVFPFKSYLDRHLRVHTGARPYKCHYCDKWFSIMGNCVAHQRSIHPERPVVRPERADDTSMF